VSRHGHIIVLTLETLFEGIGHFQLRLQRSEFARGRIVPITASRVRNANAPATKNVADGPMFDHEVRLLRLQAAAQFR
jgi:hypothetical protein